MVLCGGRCAVYFVGRGVRRGRSLGAFAGKFRPFPSPVTFATPGANIGVRASVTAANEELLRAPMVGRLNGDGFAHGALWRDLTAKLKSG